MSAAAIPILQVSGLGKSFGTPVLRDFDLMLMPGEVHALVGGNGAGKSTLARIIAGLLTPDAGALTLGGQPYRPRNRREAQAAGVTLMLQELNVLPTLTIAENLYLHALPSRFGFVDRRKLRERATVALTRVGLGQLDPFTLASRLGIGEQQMVELAAALDEDCRLLILDEPTAALTGREAEALFGQIERLRAAGVCIVYISHRMEELRRIADRVSVLRDGQRVATLPMADTSPQELVRLMAGAEVATRPTERSARRGPVILKVDGLRSRPLVEDVSFELHGGEILGLSGLVGAGRTRTLRTLFGAERRDGGTVTYRGKAVQFREPADAVAAGWALVPEDRKAHGLLLPESARVNLTLASLRGFWLNETEETRVATPIRDRLAVKCDTLEQTAASLSGGNQQKLVLGRWLLRETRVLLLDEPTRGVDVPAKESIYALLRELAASGMAILVVSSELPELMSLCDRIVVLSAGRVAGTFSPEDWSAEKLTEAAFHFHHAPVS